jgi:hypothetical protein
MIVQLIGSPSIARVAIIIANASHDTPDPVRFDHPFQINIIYQGSQMRV